MTYRKVAIRIVTSGSVYGDAVNAAGTRLLMTVLTSIALHLRG